MIDVRNADNKMLKGLKTSTAPKWAKYMVRKALQGKKFAEDIGFLDPNKFAQIEVQEYPEMKTQPIGDFEVQNNEQGSGMSINKLKQKIKRQMNKKKELPGIRLKKRLAKIYM